MGLAQGKLTLPHVEDKIKAETASEPIRTESVKETASQPDTLKDNSHIHSTVIDSTAESIPNGDQSVANGTIGSTESAGETDHGRRKSKNPLGWIKRRLSKKSNEARRPSNDQAAVSEGVETPVHEKPEESLVSSGTQASSDQTIAKQVEITEAAISLVEEVLSSAVIAEKDVVENGHVSEEANVESEVLPEQSQEDQLPADTSSESVIQHENEPASPEPTSEVQTCHLNGDHRMEEDNSKTVDLDDSCPDTKSPRSTETESDNDHLVDEAAATKLAGMDLSNEHSYELTNSDTVDSEAATHSEIVH